MESWMKEIGVVLSARELGVTEDMLDGIADATFLLEKQPAHSRDFSRELAGHSF